MSQKFLCIRSLATSPCFHSVSSPPPLFLFSFRSTSSSPLSFTRFLRFSSFVSDPVMQNRKANMQKKGEHKKQVWKRNPKASAGATSSSVRNAYEDVTDNIDSLTVSRGRSPSFPPASSGQKTIWKPNSYATVSEGLAAEIQSKKGEKPVAERSTADLNKLFGGSLLNEFNVDNSTYALSQIRATFYPKFENEKSDHEIRSRMTDLVANGQATLEVSLKHSGSLFMYAGHEGGAYAKNSFANVYTAVGVFVLGRMFRESWGTLAEKKQAEFNEFLEKNSMCISMELVTAVLGDHGQRPREDYVVVTAVTELGHGKPKFYSTPDIIAFCRKWRLPNNHVWLFSTRKSVTSFFAAYDALYEEGTATSVCQVLDEVADLSVPGSKDHIKVQGEILEGLVARIVSHESSTHMENVLRDFPLPPVDGAGPDLGPSLREICAANRSDEYEQVKAILENVGTTFCPDHSDWFRKPNDVHSTATDRSVVSKFLQAHPADFSTSKLQEVLRLMREKNFRANYKCYHNVHKLQCFTKDSLHYRMVIHVLNDSVFQRYQKEMKRNPGLWPLYRGYFVDINLFKADKHRAASIVRNKNLVEDISGSNDTSKYGLADEDANLMIKLKFLTYKMRTFLIRNGLSILFTKDLDAYRSYYRRQMTQWRVSARKQRDLSKMLDEWAIYIRGKYNYKKLSSSMYLSEAEPFLEQYAKRSPENQALIGAAGNLVRSEDFLVIVEEGGDEEGDLEKVPEIAPATPSHTLQDSVPKNEGLIVFFPGIPGCAKSALCKEIMNSHEKLEDKRPVHSLMGDLVKGRYWKKVADERRKRPYSIMLADKNAPNVEVWDQIEEMCRSTQASAVPVVPDSEGTESNPFSLDTLAVFIFRVLHRVNHPGNLDRASPNAGYVLLMFYHLYEGDNRQDFEDLLIRRFGSLIRMPVLKHDRSSLPDPVKSILEEGINLYRLHTAKHGRMDSTKGTYAKDWVKWESRLRQILFANSEYFDSVQVPFETAVQQVLEQLKTAAKREYEIKGLEKRSGSTIFSAISLPVSNIQSLLENVGKKYPQVKSFLEDKHLEEKLKKAHVTLAHRGSHSVGAVCKYAQYLHREVPVDVTAILYNDKMAALDACIGSVDGEQIISKNEWPHITLWTEKGVPAKEANMLPQLLSEGKATQIMFDPPITISGPLEFY